jgi:SAM-dependent methyltransferase
VVKDLRDHFSECADAYAVYRPVYPRALAEYLARLGSARELVWEAGCGSGQLTVFLADVFERVIAADPSGEQLAHAVTRPNIEYRQSRAEASGLPDRVADVVVAAQAAHWFDLPGFYAEARRVGRAGSALALVSYGTVSAGADLDDVIHEFHSRTLAPYWPAERHHVDAGYRTIDFPFDELPAPELEMRVTWTLPEFLGYMRTWSAVRALVRAGAIATLESVEQELTKRWQRGRERREIQWPLAIRAGRLHPW